MFLAPGDVEVAVAKFGDITGMQVAIGQVAGGIVSVVVTRAKGRRAHQQFAIDQLGFDTVEQLARRANAPLGGRIQRDDR
ncbi:hypothetical protein D3C79_860400 [compost metagenome]